MACGYGIKPTKLQRDLKGRDEYIMILKCEVCGNHNGADPQEVFKNKNSILKGNIQEDAFREITNQKSLSLEYNAVFINAD